MSRWVVWVTREGSPIMYANPTEAHTHQACESERAFRALEHDGTLKDAVGSYGLGVRTTGVLTTLVYARVWGKNIGEPIWPPMGWTQTDFDDEMDKLVLSRLGKYRCLDCGNFHGGATHLQKGDDPSRCYQCGGPSEEIA